MAAVQSPSSSTLRTAAKVALVAVGVLSAVGVAAAVRFDYKRRNDPVFRKKLLRESKKVEKKVQHKQEAGQGQVQEALRRAIRLVNAEQVPETAEGKEQFFMEQVSLGEQLSARSPEFYVASAISFYKALKVYPAPQELLMIYQKTQPQPVFDLVMELISLEISDQQSAAASSSSRLANNEDPLLEEIAAGGEQKKVVGEEDEDEEEITIGSGAASSSSAPKSVSSDGNSPSSGTSSFVHVESDAVVTPAGEVVAEETTAVVADVEDVIEAVVEAVEEAAEKVEESVEEKKESGEIDPPEPVLA